MTVDALVGPRFSPIMGWCRHNDSHFLRATKVELIINLKTANSLNITFPLPLLGRADEIIE